MRRIFTTTQAGEHLGVSRMTIVRLTQQGHLHTAPGFTARRYTLGELTRYEESTGAAPTASDRPTLKVVAS